MNDFDEKLNLKDYNTFAIDSVASVCVYANSEEEIKLFFEGARQIYLEDYKQAIGFNQIENAQCLKVDFADMLITRIEVHV